MEALNLTPIQEQLHLTLRGKPEHIAIETDDYARVLADITLAAAALELGVYRLTLTDGLRTYPAGKEIAPRQPQQPLVMLDDLLGDKFQSHVKLENGAGAVVVIEDFHQVLDKMLTVRTRFREVTARLRLRAKDGPTVLIVSVGKAMQVAPEMRASTVEITYPAPTPAELDEVIARHAARMRADGRITVDDSPQTLGKLRNALTGLGLRAANTTLAQAVARHQCLSAAIVPDLLEGRKQLFRSVAGNSGAQFITPPPRFQMAGNERFKHFVRRVSKILSDPAPAAALPRAVLLIGPPGTGKTRLAFYMAAETALPMILVSLGGLAGEGGGRVGAIPGAMRALQTAAEACAPCIILLDEVLKHVDSTDNAKRGGGTAEYARAVADFQTWSETRTEPVIVFGTANVGDMHTGFPEGFIERFNYRWLTAKPNVAQRAEIFGIELEARGLARADFGLDELADHTDGWVGREIRDVVAEAQGRAYDAAQAFCQTHLLAAIAALQTDTQEIGGWTFRLMDDPQPSVDDARESLLVLA